MSDEKTTPKRKRKANGSDAEGDAASHAAERTGASRWQSRIIGEADVSPKLLHANPANWRKHPEAQQNVMIGALDEIGWIQRVIVNKRTGNIVDGHLRVELALKGKEKSVPVCYVDLSEEEEHIALATFDPISAMAMTDERLFASLVEGIACENELLAGLLKKDLEQTAGASGTGSTDQSGSINERYEVLVTLDNENDQAMLLFKLTEEGYTCRSLIS